MTLPPIAYFGNDWFADNRTSSHHVARQLSRYARVLYLETPGLRPPQATSRDFRRLATKLGRAFRRHQAMEHVTVRTLPQLPLHGSALARQVNAVASSLFTRAILRKERMDRPIVWCTIPHVAHIVERIPRALLVYHCIDDYSALPGVDAVAVRAMDERLTRAADLVIAASRPVFDAKRELNPATSLMPHGVDVAHFSQARTVSFEEPAELRGLKRPIVGFFGLIEQWIDLDLVDWLASRRPDVTFVMIGRLAVPAESAPRSPNVVLLGPRPYEELPRYGSFFDAAIIPYRLTDQVIAANPLKLREYLAMGLPVVSVSTPEIDKFADVVAIARTREAFHDALGTALAEGNAPGLAERRMNWIHNDSWDARVANLVGHVSATIANRSATRVA
jgi:glycosyltransferase involved in cell wall biosynthesis